MEPTVGDGHRCAINSLLVPGKVLYLNALIHKRTFKSRWNKAGVVCGFEILEEHPRNNNFPELVVINI